LPQSSSNEHGPSTLRRSTAITESQRESILDQVRFFAEAQLPRPEFVPGESRIPVSGECLDTADYAAPVDVSRDGWRTAGRFRPLFERALAKYGGARSSNLVNYSSSADLVASLFGADARREVDPGDRPNEANLLALNAAKSESELGWHDRLTFRDGVEWTVAWELETRDGRDARELTVAQISTFESLA